MKIMQMRSLKGIFLLTALLILVSSIIAEEPEMPEFEEILDEPGPVFLENDMVVSNGSGGCKTQEECMKYCIEHKEECMAWKSEGRNMPPREYREESQIPFDKMSAECNMHRVFEISNPESYMQYCSNPEEMVDRLIEEMKAKGGENGCSCIERKLEECEKKDWCSNEVEDKNEMHCELPDKEEMMKHCGIPDSEEPNDDDKAEDEEGEDHEENTEEKEEEYDEEGEHENNQNEDDKEEMKEQECKKEVEVKYNEMKEECERKKENMNEMKEQVYSQCEQEHDQRCSSIREALNHCKEFSNFEKMRSQMIEKGKMMCSMYKQHRNMFQMMGRFGDDTRSAVSAAMEKVQEAEESESEIKQEHEKKPIFKRLMELLGFAKKNLEEGSAELSDAATSIEKAIQELEAIKERIDDQEAKEGLENQIEELKHKKADLQQKAAELGSKATGFFPAVGYVLKSL